MIVRWGAALLGAIVLVVGAGCGGERGASTTGTPPPPPTPPPPTETAPTTTAAARDLAVRVYLLRGEHVGVARRLVPRSEAVGSEAMRELLGGPTRAERGAGLTTTIPAGTELLGLDISGGVATVDLSRTFESGGGSLSMTARLAQVVYTLTQFPTVQEVLFSLDGEPVEQIGGEGVVLDGPVGRKDFEELTPAILVESPAPGEAISSPVRIHGTANTNEATFVVRLLLHAAGARAFEQVVTATSGTGTRGTFDVTVPYEVSASGPGTLVAFESSAADGAPINVVEIPVHVTP